MSWGVEVENLTKVFGNVVALNNINLKLDKGKVHVIAGPNGAGKTTFLRIVYTELLPTTGNVKVLSYDIYKEAAEIRKRIGVLPQEIVPYEDLSVWEHVYFLALLKGLDRRLAAAETSGLLKLFGIHDRSKTLVRDLSGGLKRQVLLIQSLIGRSDLLLLDEPTAGLDPQTRQKVWEIIHEIHQKNNITVIITTHYLDEIQDLVDRVIIFNKGSILMDGDVANVLNTLGYHMQVKLKIAPEKQEKVSNTLKAFGLKNSILPDGTITLWVSTHLVEPLFDFIKEQRLKPEDIEFRRPSLEEAYLNIVRGAK